jgi:hypothetical protein
MMADPVSEEESSEESSEEEEEEEESSWEEEEESESESKLSGGVGVVVTCELKVVVINLRVATQITVCIAATLQLNRETRGQALTPLYL